MITRIEVWVILPISERLMYVNTSISWSFIWHFQWCFVCWLPEEGFCADLSERGRGHKMGAPPWFVNLKKHNYRELPNIWTHFDGHPNFHFTFIEAIRTWIKRPFSTLGKSGGEADPRYQSREGVQQLCRWRQKNTNNRKNTKTNTKTKKVPEYHNVFETNRVLGF